MSAKLSGRHPADRSRKIIASPRPSTGRPSGATASDRSGSTYIQRDTSPAFGADQVKMTAGMIERAAQRESDNILYGKRSTRKLRTQPICPACGLMRSASGKCDCNTY